MNYRTVTVWPRTAYTSDTTEIIDIKLKDPISRLVVVYEATNGASAGQQGHPDKCITKMELIDGGDTIWSLTGMEAKAADFYHNKMVGPSLVIYPNDMNSEMIYNLNFGRKLWDPMLALDPKQFDNLQLKVTIDINGGGKNCDGGYLTVTGHVFDEKAISPLGLLTVKEVKSYSVTASAHEYTRLPTDRAYRNLFIKCLVAGTGPDYEISNVKLSQDVDKHVILDHSIGAILRNLVAQYPPYNEWVISDPPTPSGMYTYITPGYWPTALAQEWLVPPCGQLVTCYGGDGGYLHLGTEGSWTSNVQIHVRGWCPHSVIPIPLGDPEDIEDWFSPARDSSLDLDIEAASGGSGTWDIFLEQLRRY